MIMVKKNLAGKVLQYCNMNSKKFFDACNTIKSQEDRANWFSVAASKRKLLALNYYAALQLGESISETEFVLNEDLKKYAKIVDCTDSGRINNYADCVLSVLSNFPADERHNWKSHLSAWNIAEHLKLLPCSNNINCRNNELLLNKFKSMKPAFLQYKEVYDLKEPEICINNHLMLKKNFSEQSDSDNLRNTQSLSTKSQNDEDMPKNKSFLFFRTARDELQIMNSKKFGKNSNLNEKNLQVPLKKSLGTRKNGIYGKFQPPLRSNETKENENKMEVDEVVDERLKNIDPAMIELIKSEIMDSGSRITWDDIAGLHLAKNTIQEIVVWPMLRPDIFTGLRRPPKGILLFGPPGTGKTLIGKCIASQSNSTFFSISASSLTSKWVGDGEKMVRTLFAVAKVYQPSVVFIDEIDSLLTQRSDSDHECSRRIKTEFLVQLDGAGTGDEDRILIIGATNRPQELDEAARRRLVKRLYIPLPDEEARKQIIQNLISSEQHCLTDSEIQEVAKLTKGYSGADVKNLCQEASLGPIRSIAPDMITSINPKDVRPLNAKDFELALCRIKSSVSESDLDIYLAWDKQYGCGSTYK